MVSFLSWGIAATIWLALVLFFRYHRIWLLYYTVASVGLALLVVFAGARLSPLEQWLEYATAYNAHSICNLFHIPTYVFKAAPGNILVWVIVQQPGWTVVRVDLECSGLLEMAVLIGLLLFYPGWPAGKRAGLILAGLMAIYGANIVRVVSIISILHFFGKPTIFVAHTIIGRLLFFVLVTGILWAIISRVTIRTLAEHVQARMKV